MNPPNPSLGALPQEALPDPRPERVLVVVAHPDDEVLGFGGTIATHLHGGDVVRVVIVADNARSIAGAVLLPAATRKAATMLGIQKPDFLGRRGMTLGTMREIELTQIIAPAFTEHRPTLVYTHHAGDLNSDHRAVSRAVQILSRPQPGNTVRRLLTGEIPSSTEWGLEPFKPNVFVDVTRTIDLKLSAMALYEDEVRETPHPRSLPMLRARAACWGSVAGVEYAEAFTLIREVF
jgi:LmbE family N-acetylglucosaminyl deacetylase